MLPRIFVGFGTLLAAAILPLQPAWSQGRGGGGSAPPSTGTGSTGTGTGTGGITGRTTGSIPSTTNNPNNAPSIPQPIFLSGRVMLEDGTAPPDTVTIERVCNGVPHAEGYTDSRGYFGIQLGQNNNGVLQDASETGGPGGGMQNAGTGFGRSSMGSLPGGGPSSMGGMDQRFFACELRAKLSGFRSQSVNLATHRAMDNPDLGTILLHRIGPSEGSTISAVSLAAPKDARKAFEKGLAAVKKNKSDDATKDFQKAVEVYPNYSAAWCELGKLQAIQGDFYTARGSFQYAVKADPTFVVPYLELSLIAMNSQKWQEAADTTERAVTLDPFDYPQAFLFNAVANYNLKKIDAAEKSVRQALKLDTQHQYPKSFHLLGLILVRHQDYSGAAEQFRTYLQLAPDAPDAAAVRSQLAAMEKVSAQNAANRDH
ncbi:MAG: tetratricopeptide repeat protein [Acidobacteriia bacterium]|nr:tetratricopeptide repeat protein [Terriglobia bacterium]